jgi:hypothetical protein
MVEEAKVGVVRINTDSGNGTGVIFETTGNGRAFVLTNFHVVEEAYWIEVQVSDGSAYSATLKGYDAYKDLAVLEICCSRFRSLRFKDATTLKSGSEVVAIGYPLGLFGAATVTRGIVSAVRYDSTHRAWVIQTDAPINPGNSGGPLLSSAGEVVGINTYSLDWSSEGRPIDGVGFAISEQTIRGVLQSMKLGSRVSFPTPTATPWPTPTSTPGPTPAPVPVGWKTYNNWTYGYSIEVPSDWSIDESDKSSVYLRSQDGAADIYLLSFSSNLGSLEGWIERAARDNRSRSKVFFQELDRYTRVEPDGRGGGYLVFRSHESIDYCVDYSTYFFFFSHGRSFLAEIDVCEHSLDLLGPITDRIWDSFIYH